jgi:hypothetical protein
MQPVFVNFAQPHRDMDEGITVRAAGFEQQQANRGVFAQAARLRATGRPGSDDHVIVRTSSQACGLPRRAIDGDLTFVNQPLGTATAIIPDYEFLVFGRGEAQGRSA